MMDADSAREVMLRLQDMRPLVDSGKRHFEIERDDDGYSILVSDPVNKRHLGTVHPLSFIEMWLPIINAIASGKTVES